MSDEFLFGHMVHEYYVSRLRAIAAKRAEERARIRTPDQVRRLRDEVRRKLRACFGPFPQRTPLNARVTGRLERSYYTVENVIFESRPNYPVTANLYVPHVSKGKPGSCPIVVVSCGHSQNGKAHGYDQGAGQDFARQGYLTMVYDPISQGERLQFPRREGARWPRWSVEDHCMLGNQMSLVGEFLGVWGLWDGMRAIDYLISRPEADGTRIGAIGYSGGGMLTAYLAAFDERVTMAAPSCWITTHLSNIENELRDDSEQVPPGLHAEGLDAADYFVAHIPRPTILLGEKNDFFDRRGLRATYEELRRLYAILGAEENIQLYIGPEEHSFKMAQRQAAYRFFNRHAGMKTHATGLEKPEKEALLQVTKEGQVLFMGARRAPDFTKERACALAERREEARRAGKLSGAALAALIERLLNLPPAPAFRSPRRLAAGKTVRGPASPEDAPYYRVLRAHGPQGKVPSFARREGEFESSFAVETDPGILAILHLFDRTGYFHYIPSGSDATVYVPHRSSRGEVDAGKTPAPVMLFALDARGIGDVTAMSCGIFDFFEPTGCDYVYASHGKYLNECYCGRRVHDLLRALDLLRANGWRSAHLVGRGLGAVSALFAACLHPMVKRVTLHNGLLSYHELTQVAVQSWPLSSLVPGILEHFDLPDCYRALAGKRLTLVEPWDGQMRPWRREPLRRHLKMLGLERVRVVNVK
jgi:dienelactone hydrolase